MNGREHYEAAAAILRGIAAKPQLSHDWILALSTQALAHAQLATAARDYGLHVEPRKPVIEIEDLMIDHDETGQY